MMACHESQLLHLSQAESVFRYISCEGGLHAVDISQTKYTLVYSLVHQAR